MLHRTYKRLIARICLGALLFMQLAVAAYACPGLLAMGNIDHASMASESMDHSSMNGCGETDKNDPNLCDAYLHAADQSDARASLAVSPVAVISPLTTVEPLVRSLATGIVGSAPLLQRTTAPPPHLLFGVLRI